MKEVITRVGAKAQKALNEGKWREFKLSLRLLACLQPLFTGDGVFSVFDELFNRAVDLQSASQEDVRSPKKVVIKLTSS